MRILKEMLKVYKWKVTYTDDSGKNHGEWELTGNGFKCLESVFRHYRRITRRLKF